LFRWVGTLGLVFGALTEGPVSWATLLRRGGSKRIDTGA
jgi:hypothetical protein